MHVCLSSFTGFAVSRLKFLQVHLVHDENQCTLNLTFASAHSDQSPLGTWRYFVFLAIQRAPSDLWSNSADVQMISVFLGAAQRCFLMLKLILNWNFLHRPKFRSNINIEKISVFNSEERFGRYLASLTEPRHMDGENHPFPHVTGKYFETSLHASRVSLGSTCSLNRFQGF